MSAAGSLMMSLHSWLLRTPRHTILVDTCVGNHKTRSRKMWDNLDTPWLDRLKAAGVAPEEVDFVLCTHLHTDHVGWNTRLENGRWVPTFPNAKYLIGKIDYQYRTQRLELFPDEEPMDGAFADSVLPVVEAGQAVMVEDGYRIDEAMTDRGRARPHARPCHHGARVRRRGSAVRRRHHAPPGPRSTNRTGTRPSASGRSMRRSPGAACWSGWRTRRRC